MDPELYPDCEILKDEETRDFDFDLEVGVLFGVTLSSIAWTSLATKPLGGRVVSVEFTLTLDQLCTLS